MKAKLKKGEIVSKQLDGSMLIIKWMDKHEVMIPSTIQDDSFVTKKRRPDQQQMGRKASSNPL